MCKRTLSVLCCLLFCMTQAFSQDKGKELFSQSAGFTWFAGVKGDSALISASIGYGLTYSPRINFAVLSPSSSFSVGTHLTAGFSASTTNDAYSNYGSIDGTDLSFSYMVDLPLVVEYNFGAAATRDAYKKLGFFVGGGYGWHFTQDKARFYDANGNTNIIKEDVAARGPVFNAGFRFPVGLGVLGIRVQYHSISNPGFIARTDGLFGMGVEYNFGAPSHKRK